MAARVDHMEAKIKPALAQSEWVLCDRFYDSTYVYQGIAKNVGTTWLDQLYTMLLGNHGPDMTLLLDIDPEVGLGRADKRGNVAESRFEQMGLGYHQSLRAGFLELAKKHPSRIHLINAANPPDQVHAAIIEKLNARFGLALMPQALV